MQLLHLKSGTDVRGTAINPENPEKIDLTDEAVRRIEKITGQTVKFYKEDILNEEKLQAHTPTHTHGRAKLEITLSIDGHFIGPHHLVREILLCRFLQIRREVTTL